MSLCSTNPSGTPKFWLWLEYCC